MKNLFYLKEFQDEISFDDVNAELKLKSSSYLTSFGEVGSDAWWKKYENDQLDIQTWNGNAIGFRDENVDGEDRYILDLETDKATLELEVPVIVEVGKYVEIDLVTIYPDLDSPDEIFQFILSIRQQA